jgi:hypothetical protein
MNAAPAYYTEAPSYLNTKAVEYYTELHKYYSDPNYTTTIGAAKYYNGITLQPNGKHYCFYMEFCIALLFFSFRYYASYYWELRSNC